MNGIPANSFMIVSGGATIHFYFNTSPAVQGQNTIHIAACAFFCISGVCARIHLHVLLRATRAYTYFDSDCTPTPTPRPALTPRPRPTPPPRP